MTVSIPSHVRDTAFALIVAGTVLVATACAGSSPTEPSSGGSSGTTGSSGTSQPTSIAGTYRLASVNGRSVPCVFDSYSPGLGVTMEMRAMDGAIFVNPDGTYVQELEMHLTRGSLGPDIVTTKTGVGVYTLQGSTLTMTPFEGQPFTPAYSAGRIEITAEAPGLDGQMDRVTFTYQR